MTIWAREDVGLAFAQQLRARQDDLAAGATPVGWKVGFGTPAALAGLDIDAPLVGYLLGGGLLPSGATVSLSGWTAPKIETEIAVHLAADLPAGAGADEAAAAIGGLSLAFELVDIDAALSDPIAILERNVFQRHVVLGPRRPPGPPPLVDIVVDDQPAAAGADPSAAIGDLAAVTAHVADVVGRFGPGLKAGDVIITGAIVPALDLGAGEHHVARATGLGEIAIHATA